MNTPAVVSFHYTLRDEPHPTHFSVSEALDVIARVKPKRAYLTHVSHSLEYEATNARLPAGVIEYGWLDRAPGLPSLTKPASASTGSSR